MLANGYISEIEYPEYDKMVKVHGFSWYFSETPPRIRVAPKLGQPNVEILKSLGYDKAKIAGLKGHKVI